MIYSRNLELLSRSYPDVIENIIAFTPKNVDNYIMDTELVAYDIQNEKILPFQTLCHRSRKHITKEDLENKVAMFAFDLLYLNDEPLINKALHERRTILKNTFEIVHGQLYFAQYADISDFDALEKFLQQSIKDGCEGLMVKTLKVNAIYEASKRSLNWLKLKKDYLDDLGDSLDLVLVGADYGTGKRTGQFSSFLLGCYNEKSGKYQNNL